MSKLQKAPLIEVIFEIRWNSTNKQEIDKFQLLIGSLYASLKDDYEKPLNLLPDPNIPIQALLGKAIYRSRKKNGIPVLYQLGPGILSINYVGSDYDWDIFYNEICKIVEIFRILYPFNAKKDVQMSLKYLDFFDYKFDQGNIFDYLKEKFHLSIDAEYIQNSIGINFSTIQKVNDAFFNLTINTGKLNDQRTGLVVESKLTTNQYSENFDILFKPTLLDFHLYLSDFFKSLTKGDLYESFN